MKSAAAYIRVSTQEQAEYSPDSQLSAIRGYAERGGFVLKDENIFIDEGLSGRNAQRRPAFQRMVARARQRPRPFDVVLLWKYSRFARSREDSVVYKSLLRRECGVEVLSVSEPLGVDKTSVLIEALIEAMDEYYSLNLSEEVRRGMREKTARGEPVCAAPLGYRMERKQYVPDPDTAGTVRLIFRLCADGSGPREIAERLNALGLQTVRKRAFSARGVGYILQNRCYLGEIGGLPAHAPVIEPGQFDAARKRLAHSGRPRGRYARVPADGRLLSGLVRCSACGHTLVRTGESMQCHAYAKGQCGESHSILVRLLDARVLSRIERDFRDAAPPAALDAGLPALLRGGVLSAPQKNRLLRIFIDHIVFDRRENQVALYYRLQ